MTSTRSTRARGAAIVLLGATTALFAANAPVSERGVVARAIDAAYDGALGKAAETATAGAFGATHASWDDPWVAGSEHYEVSTTKSRAYALRMAQSLEGMLPIFQDVLGTDYAPRQKFSVLIHPTIADYNAFGDAHSDERSSFFGGYYADASPNRSVATFIDSNRTRELFFLTHGAAQQYLAHAFPGPEHPAFLSQGLGAYFQSFWDYPYLVRRYETLRDARSGAGLPALAQVLQEPISAYADGNAENRFVQLAMTVIYLRKVKEETRSTFDANGNIAEVGPFDEYLRKLVRREDVSDHAVNALFAEGAQELDEEIRAFRGW